MITAIFLHLESDQYNSIVINYLNQIVDPFNLYITHNKNEVLKDYNRFTPAVFKIHERGRDIGAFLRTIDYWQKKGNNEEVIFKIKVPNKMEKNFLPERYLELAIGDIIEKWDKIMSVFKTDTVIGCFGSGTLYENNVINYESLINEYFENFNLLRRVTGHFLGDTFIAKSKPINTFFKNNNPISILSDFEFDPPMFSKIDAFRKIWYAIFRNEGLEVRDAKNL